jgi:hypothetical protein
MTSKMSLSVENEKLRKMLLHAKNQISELKDELKDQEKTKSKIQEVCLPSPIP